MRHDPHTPDLFAGAPERPGTLGCSIEIAATMAEALEMARQQGVTRGEVAVRMAYHLGEKLSEATLNGYCAQSHDDREITLKRAMAFDAALGSDVLLSLYTRKRGGRVVMSEDDAALLEWARLHQEEKALSERKRALEAVLKLKGAGK